MRRDAGRGKTSQSERGDESKKREQSQKEKVGGTVEGKKERGDGRADGRRLRSGSEGVAVEVGMRVLEFELLDGPPGGGGVGDDAVYAFPYSRMENTNHMTLAIEDERARVTRGGERAGILIVVIDGEFDGLLAKVIAKVGLGASVASNREVGGVTVLHDNKAGLVVLVTTIGSSQLLARDTTVDPELVICRELEHRLTVSSRVKHLLELTRSKLGS